MKTIDAGIDHKMAFQFLGVHDTGPDSGAHCPHCGAEGRYIYNWAEYGEVRAAMAGCYQMLTGKIVKGDYEKVMEGIAVKLSRNKPLNGWEKTIIRMEDFKSAGKYPVEWCDQKIREALRDRKGYIANRFR
jgi:hypothetical protein